MRQSFAQTWRPWKLSEAVRSSSTCGELNRTATASRSSLRNWKLPKRTSEPINLILHLQPWLGSKTKLCVVSLHASASAPLALRCVWGQKYLCLDRMLFSSASTLRPTAWRKGLLRGICRAESRPVKTELHLRPEQHHQVKISSYHGKVRPSSAI